MMIGGLTFSFRVPSWTVKMSTNKNDSDWEIVCDSFKMSLYYTLNSKEVKSIYLISHVISFLTALLKGGKNVETKKNKIFLSKKGAM